MDIYCDSDDSDDEYGESDGSVLYRILYEDGDAEDLEELECREGMDLYNKLESEEINRWEIGGDD